MLQQLKDPDDVFIWPATPPAPHEDGLQVWPALVNVYHDQGFAEGYHRGISESLASAFEAAEEFLLQRPESAIETRRLLHAFIDFFEQRVRPSASASETDFVDGLGI